MKFALIFTLAIIASFARAKEDALIQIKPVVEVDGTSAEIMLGDLIISRGVSDGVLATVRRIRLADTPKMGESRSFTALGLEEVFRPHLREIEESTGEKILLRVPARVTVTRKAFRLRREDIEAEMKQQLKAVCADCKFEITDLRLPLVAPAVSAASSWTLRMRPEMPKGSFSIPLEVRNEDGSKRTYWVSGAILVTRVVPVATRTLQFGEKLRAEDYLMETKDVTFATDAAATIQDIEASVTSRQVAAGQIIWRGGLKREMAVKHGESVKVMAGGDTWQIVIDGIAQGSGYIGDTVKVKIPRTQKLVSGLLKEKGVVEVQ